MKDLSIQISFPTETTIRSKALFKVGDIVPTSIKGHNAEIIVGPEFAYYPWTRWIMSKLEGSYSHTYKYRIKFRPSQ